MPPSQTQQNQALQRYRKWVLLAIFAFVTLFTILWWAGRGTIEVIVSSNSSKEITYRFVNQANNEATEVKDTAKHIKKTLSKGKYEVTVTQDKKNYFSVAQTGDTVKASPEAEKGRRFIGNEPRPCTYLAGVILLSYDCKSGLNTLQTHQPATAGLPTLNKPVFPQVEDVIEGIVHTKAGQDIILTLEAEVAGHEEFEGQEHSAHAAMVLEGNTQGVTFKDPTDLPALADRDRYGVVAYQEGFIAYNESFSQLLYYKTLSEPPVKLAVENLNADGFSPVAISTKDDAYVVTYGHEEDRTAVVVHTGNQPRRYTFDKVLTSVRLCGNQKLCVVTKDELLEVYDISKNQEEPPVQYVVADKVKGVENLGDRLLVIREREVIALDVENRSGTIQYSFGPYKLCGLQTTADSYLLCVTNKKNTQSVLAIDQQQPSDDIDKKVAELLSLQAIKALSIYGDFMFITPNAGKQTYSPQEDSYIYNPSTLRNANNKINQTIEKVGIDQNKYKIKNTITE